MKVRALGDQLTFYDDDGNVIGHDPPLPPEDPDEEVRMINIVDFEDRLMGIDPDADPDFFFDLKELEKFADDNKAKRRCFPIGPMNVDYVVYTMLMITLLLVSGLFGFMTMNNYLESMTQM